MWLRRLCVLAVLAATLPALAACGGGGYGGVPATPDMPGSADGGPDMPEPAESAEPPPQGGSVVPQPLGSPVVDASSAPNVPSPSASVSASLPFVPHPSGSPIAADVRAASSFTLQSTTFKNHKSVPLTMVYKGNGCNGGNMSPELQWSGAPKKTKSFAVLMLDTTAIFWHWGMYGIVKAATSLPQNAGTSTSKYGKAVLNDWSAYFGSKKNRGYGGPCPPPGRAHHYVFTLYALDTTPHLAPSAHAEDLDLAIRGHILGSAAIAGIYKK